MVAPQEITLSSTLPLARVNRETCDQDILIRRMSLINGKIMMLKITSWPSGEAPKQSLVMVVIVCLWLTGTHLSLNKTLSSQTRRLLWPKNWKGEDCYRWSDVLHPSHNWPQQPHSLGVNMLLHWRFNRTCSFKGLQILHSLHCLHYYTLDSAVHDSCEEENDHRCTQWLCSDWPLGSPTDPSCRERDTFPLRECSCQSFAV